MGQSTIEPGACRRRAAQAGQVAVFVAVLLPLFLAVIGLALDGGLVFSARRELQNVADGAARAGAMQIDVATYDATNGQTVVLDRRQATQVASEYIVSQDPRVAASIDAEPQRVVVQAGRTVPTGFLRVLGIASVQISATASAEVRHGITQANR